MEVHALKERGWSITAIANHLGHDRTTFRVHLQGERVPGVRARVAPDPLEPFVPYFTQRLLDDPHLECPGRQLPELDGCHAVWEVGRGCLVPERLL